MQEFGKKLVPSSKHMRQSILQNTTLSRQCRRPWQRATHTDESSLIIRHRCLTDLQYQQLVVFQRYLPKHQSQHQQWPGSGLMASAKPGRHLQEPLFSYKTRLSHYTTPESRLSFMLTVFSLVHMARCSNSRITTQNCKFNPWLCFLIPFNDEVSLSCFFKLVNSSVL